MYVQRPSDVYPTSVGRFFCAYAHIFLSLRLQIFLPMPTNFSAYIYKSFCLHLQIFLPMPAFLTPRRLQISVSSRYSLFLQADFY